ncbi:unnamed protein product, partial [Onchocerca ochengi]|uniref:Chitin-binding type-2 domain-containing protein n=1 Tax=Onchocerca ochengi TaxID=42157 RepID=A0A182E892_ONCOC
RYLVTRVTRDKRREMNLQRLTLLLVLIALIFCYVICTKVNKKQHPEFFDGSYSTMKKQWITKYQGYKSRLVDQLDSKKEKEVDMVPRPSTYRGPDLKESGDVSDDIAKYDQKAADMVKILDVNKMRQLSFKPVWRKRTARAYDYIRLRNLQSKCWNGEIGQYEEECEDILAASKLGERHPSGKEENADPLKCAGRKDGIYEVAPCEQWYLSCHNGEAKKVFCDDGLYWNGDKNRCEPEANIFYCRLRFDCTGLHSGIYVDGCSNVYWFCHSGTASLSKCPKNLYFNIKKLRCDVKEMIPACGGIDQDEMKPIKSNEKSFEMSKQQVIQKVLNSQQNICEKRRNGKYAIGECYGKFVFCIDGNGLIANCDNGELYSPEHQECIDAGNLPSCGDLTDVETTTITTAGYSVSCSLLPDGIYALGDCERNFSICFNGVGSNVSCSQGFVYNGETGNCEYAFNVEKCPQFKKNDPESHESAAIDTDEEIIQKTVGTDRGENVCQKRENGMYAVAKCYGEYLFCINGRGLVVVCSQGQLFSPEHHQCMTSAELPSCDDFTDLETSTANARRSVPCSSLSDGVYDLGDCERNFLICFNGEGSISSCDPDLVYNKQTGNCEKKSRVEKCLKDKRWDKSASSNENIDCRYKQQKDGLYAEGCTEKFYSCSNGIPVEFECPNELVFNVDGGFCDYPKNVVACSEHQSIINDEKGAIEEETASNLVSGCSILDDGIYGSSPCGSGYYHCWHGATSFAKCAFGLVFNPFLKRCDFRENVPNCRQYNDTSDKIRKSIDRPMIMSIEGDMSRCLNLSNGFYVDGCSKVYYGCANGKTFYMSCPWNFAFNSRSGTCDEPNNVEACRITSSRELYSSLIDSIESPMPSCTTLQNGPHKLGHCLTNYISCQDGIISLFSCPEPLVFNPDNSRCTLQSDVIACGRISQLTQNKLNVQCDARPDGIFSYNCSKNFYICAKGKIYLFACPDGMAYDSNFHRCRNSTEVRACVQTVSSVAPLPQKPLHKKLDGTEKKDKFCNNRPDGNYAAGPCSEFFFSCIHMTKVLMFCPATLVFDESVNRCEETINVAQCRNQPVKSEGISIEEQDAAEQQPTSTITSFCIGRNNGIYPLNSCLRSYLQCYNQKGTVKYCPDNMVFNRNVGTCTPKGDCDQVMTTPYVFFTTDGNVGNDYSEIMKLTKEGCYELADGDYSTGCVADFITCIDGSEIHKKCPNSTVFSNVLRRCVDYEQCAFLMYRILASFYPSDRALSQWIKHKSATATPSVSPPELSLPEANSSGGKSCRYVRAHCLSTSNENVVNKPVSGRDMNHCEYAKKQCIIEGNKKVYQIPTVEHQETSGPHSQETYRNQFCLPEVSERETDSIRCDKMDDGLYAFDCSNNVVVCSSSWRKIYGCPRGQLFIPALLKCDEFWKCTKTNLCSSGFVGVIYLGKVGSITPSLSPPSTNSFSCENKEDGNYGKQCSPIYIKCIQQKTFLMRCSIARVFDRRSRRCIPSKHCPMLLINHVHDSFKHSSLLNPYLKPNQYDRSLYNLELPYTQPITAASYRNPYMFSGMLQAPSSITYIPQIPSQQHVPSIFDNSAGPFRIIKDAFRVIPSLDVSNPNMQTLGILDQFYLPGSLPTYSFTALRPISSHGSTVTSSNIDGTTSGNEATDNLEGTKSVTDDFVSGSGEADNAPTVIDGGRVKREVSFETELSENETELEMKLDAELENGYSVNEIQDLCLSKAYPSSIGLGFCRSSYILCKTKDMAFVVKCKDGHLFDGRLKKCVPAADCVLSKLYHQNNESSLCALLPDGMYALPGCSQHFLVCEAKKAFLRNCANGLYYDGRKQQCDYKERVAICNNGSIIYDQSLPNAKDHSNFENMVGVAKIAVANVAQKVSSTSPNFTCSVDNTVSLGCSPSFVICAGSIAYVFSCDNNLTTSSCNRIEDTPECNEEYSKQRVIIVTNEFSFSSSLAGLDNLPRTFVNLTKVSNDVSSFDCMVARDGLRSSQCSPFFFVCSAGQINGFVCQNALIFNPEAGLCDRKKYIVSCDGTRLFNSPATSSSTDQKVPLKPSFTTTQISLNDNAYKQWKCKKEFSGIISAGCSRKFILCIRGIDHLFFCQRGMVYNINISRCDLPQNVAACGDETRTPFRKRHETSHFDKDSVSSIRVIDLQTTDLSNNTMRARCHASRSQTAAYGLCREDYISCSKDGIFRKLYCTNNYLFDEVVGRCVPAKVCGAVIPETMSVGKKKCDDVEDGVSRGIGPCLNQYYVCKKGIPILRRCFKHSETFSATAGGCVARSLNPECPRKSTVVTDEIQELNDTDDFCINRADGLYRHPTDCTRVLQCFGEELFEHLPCNDGLVFNEISGGCDYKSNVPECAATFAKSTEDWDSPSTASNCEGKSHGDFLVDENNCSVYYRCVWGKLEKLFCPEHTVFNPVLSVCDFPSAVPYCKVTM